MTLTPIVNVVKLFLYFSSLMMLRGNKIKSLSWQAYQEQTLV